MNESRAGESKANSGARDARLFAICAGLGAALGLLSSYLYTRAAEERGEGDEATSISTAQALALLVAVVGLVRQIAELGKPKKDGKKDKS